MPYQLILIRSDIGSQCQSFIVSLCQSFCSLSDSRRRIYFREGVFPLISRARIPCLGCFPHPPSASNIASEIQVCKVQDKDVFITALYMEFNKIYYNFADAVLAAAQCLADCNCHGAEWAQTIRGDGIAANRTPGGCRHGRMAKP